MSVFFGDYGTGFCTLMSNFSVSCPENFAAHCVAPQAGISKGCKGVEVGNVKAIEILFVSARRITGQKENESKNLICIPELPDGAAHSTQTWFPFSLH